MRPAAEFAVVAAMPLLVVLGAVAVAAQSETELNTPRQTIFRRQLGEVQSLMFSTLARSEGSMLGGATFTMGKTDGVIEELTQTFGSNVRQSTCLNMNTASELLVTFAFIKIHLEHGIPASLDDEISEVHAGGRILQNPFNQRRLRYSDLLMHTSTLNDFGFESFTTTTPNTVTTLREFIETRYFSGQLGSIFASQTPGTPAAYRFARINIALTAYIIEVILGPSGINSAFGSIQSYLYQQVLRPLGMGSTFFLSSTGAPPGIIIEGTTTADFFSGCIGDQFTSGVRIHPAAVADYMVYTTPADLARLTYHLFLDDKFQAILMQMTILTRVSSSSLPALSGQGLGVMYFDGTRLCSAATSTRVVAECPIDNRTTIVGYVSQRDHVSVGVLCHPSPRYGHLCTSTMLLYSTSQTRTVAPIFAIAAAAAQELEGTVTVATPPPAPLLRTPDEERVFGVYIFIGVYLSVLLVLFGTSLLQYLLNPAALAMGADTGAAPPVGPKRDSPSRNEPSILAQSD